MFVISTGRRLSVGVILLGSLFLTRSVKATEPEGPACGLSCGAGSGSSRCTANVNEEIYQGRCTQVCCVAPAPGSESCYCAAWAS